MKTEKIRNLVILDKDDFTEYAIKNLGIWDALTKGMPQTTDAVEVIVIGAAQ